MRTIFDLGLARSPWNPGLGVTPEPGFWSTLTTGLTAGSTAYTEYERAQIAEEARQKAEAEAETKRIQAETERLRAQTAAAAAGAGGAGAGIPTGYLVAGGIGLVAIIGAIALLR